MLKRLLGIMIIGACFASLQAQTIESFVNGLLAQYPQARLLDIYKSCFQDYMGAEHLVADTTSARQYLEQELATADLDAMLPWYYEPCGLNGGHVRVSLRAVMEGKIDAQALLQAFIASANREEIPSAESWAEQWHGIIAAIDGMCLSLPHYEQDKQFIEEILAQGKYAISHSPDYRDAYAPHYRIVRRDIFEQRLKPLLDGCCCH